MSNIKVAAVSYLNTKPLLWGIEHSAVTGEIDLLLDYPANLATGLRQGSIDLALLPVAAIPTIPGARIVSDYGIAADGEVASVAIFSQVPIDQVTEVYLDYQSRTSVKLAALLLKEHWRMPVTLLTAGADFISKIGNTTAGVIIGDRALECRGSFPYIYDLAEAWKAWTGKPFVFAAWVANKDLPEDFLERFNAAIAAGLAHIDKVVAANPCPYYDLQTYYRRNIRYHLDEEKISGLQLFLEYLEADQSLAAHALRNSPCR